ncbi:unnamed protein product [Orchesella dallaii]|uniref:F-box domain-containing protein n=1 Tax=Orchesella dallaii TaxID=48710 RepID=A0ABP1Q0U5_9HEXA
MALHIEDIPSEVLSIILDFLDTTQKFVVRGVNQRWRDSVDKNVSFCVSLCDKNYDYVRHKFGTRRVASMTIENYSRSEIPIQNLQFLHRLHIRESTKRVCDLAVRHLLLNAVKLKSLTLDDIKFGTEIAIHNQPLPALLSIEKLSVKWEQTPLSIQVSSRADNLLNHEMPKLKVLHVCQTLFATKLSRYEIDIFRLATCKPLLRQLKVEQFRPPTNDVGPAHNLTKLKKLNLTVAEADISQTDVCAWEAILSTSSKMEKLSLSYHPLEGNHGFPLSIILPVLQKSFESLVTIRLRIDPNINPHIDMKMFCDLKCIHTLCLEQRVLNAQPCIPALNLHTVLTLQTLQNFESNGLKYSGEDLLQFLDELVAHKTHVTYLCFTQHSQALRDTFEKRVCEEDLKNQFPIYNQFSDMDRLSFLITPRIQSRNQKSFCKQL